MCSMTVGHAVEAYSCSFSLLFGHLSVLTILPSSIHKATIHPAEESEQTWGGWVGGGGLAAGPIDKQSRSCDLFTTVCYVEARAGRRKAF